MPIYEYRCRKCRKHFEVLQRINEEPLSKCIHCGGEVEKLISQSTFQLKGSGWYVTDYHRRRDGESKEKKTDTQNVHKK